jgi:transposase
MAVTQTEEFRREAVRIALSRGLSRTRVAADLGIGKSTLEHWISQYRTTELPMPEPQTDLARENECLRLENRVLREESEIKKSHAVLCEPKDMRFAFIREHRACWSIERLCRILQFSTRGYRAWVSRRVCQSQRTDLKVLAHIRQQYALSNQTYGWTTSSA